MADKLSAAAMAAGLTPEEQKKIDQFKKAYEAHKELSNLPSDVANKAYERKTDAQKESLKQNFGEEDPSIKPNRGVLGTAWHYTGGAVGRALGTAGSMTLAGLQNVSDAMTRAYRIGAILATQDVDLSDAWTLSNDKGDKVFNPNRISRAKVRFGKDAVNVAMRIAAGEEPEQILKSVDPEQAKYVMLADPRNKLVPGFATEEETEAARKNFQDTLDAVQASKYSPGRQIANLVTPEQLEGSGLYYKAISGFFDAAYRIISDPLLLAGKAKRLYDASKYALDVVVGANKVDEVFAKPQVISFWDNYGQKLQNLTKAEESKKTEDIIAAKRELEILAPEFGPAVIKSFQKADGGGVVDALTAKAFFQNAKQTDEIIKGGIGRKRIILPRMSVGRQLRIAAVTTGNKVLNLDKIGPKFVDDYFFGGATDADGIAETVINNRKEIIEKVTEATNFKGVRRFSTRAIQYRIDRAKAKFTLAPIFQDDVFNVKAADAGEKIYRLAVMIMPRREAKLLSEAFNSIEETGKRKDVYYGLWSTIAEIRGLNTTLPGQALTRYFSGKGQSIHSVSKADDAFPDKGVLPSDFNDFVSVPSLADLDIAAARNGWTQRVLGFANSNFASNMTTAWSFLTLAGPRYALRNATEDLMVGLAIGQSPWGLAKSRMLSSRLNTVLAGITPKTGTRLEKAAENPMGSLLRMVNKKDAQRYQSEFDNLGKRIAEDNKKLNELRKSLKTTTDPAQKAVIQSDIEKLIKTTQGGIVRQTREIFAKALTEGRVNRFRDRLGMKPLNKEEADLLAEQIIYGDIENALSVVSEGGMNFATGNDYISRALDFARNMGVRTHGLTLIPPTQRYVKKPGERQYTVQALGVQDEASMVAWLMRIGYFSNDELGSIAVANIGNIDDALIIRKMTDWMNNTPQGKQFLKDARLSNDLDARGIAQVALNRTKEVFTKGAIDVDNPVINLELLNKIRSFNDETGEWVVSGKLSLDDLPKTDDDIPAYVLGPTLIPAVELNQMTSSLMNNGWTWLGLANARFSRQPLVIEEMVKIRKQMRKTGFEDAWVKSYLRGIDEKDVKKVTAATEKAKKDLAMVVEERAIGQTLAYVDNPLIRTQLAFSTRNFARFYRATEDFYRRMYRLVKYNPEGIVKAALTYEGITHSGFIQQDDQGESYFVYPGIAPVYNAVQTALARMGIGEEFKTPFPVEFGAKLKMITPSLNPDSLVPTFSGPLAGLSVGTLSSLVNIFSPGAADTIRGFALGQYAENQPFLSLVLPAHINRFYAAMDQDERNSQYASAWRKAVTYLEASGHGIPKRYDPETNELLPPTSEELEAYRQRVKNTTINILGMRFVFGFFAPASPQVQLKSDMSQWISDNGRANFKQLFNNLLDEYPGDYDAALTKWTELFPNQIAFTVTESERKTLAPLRYAEEAGYFVDNNQDLFRRYPKAAGFLIPHKSGFSWDAYQSMKDLGLVQNKRIDEFLREVQTSSDLQAYYDRKDEFESAMETSFSDYGRAKLRKEYEDWKKVFFAGRPLVKEELAEGSQKAIQRLNTVDELTNMLNENLNIRTDVQDALRKMLKVYSDYQVQRGNMEQYGTDAMLLSLKNSTRAQLRELATYNENTQAAYDVLFSRLPGIRE
jgi:hypothetical protein